MTPLGIIFGNYILGSLLAMALLAICFGFSVTYERGSNFGSDRPAIMTRRVPSGTDGFAMPYATLPMLKLIALAKPVCGELSSGFLRNSSSVPLVTTVMPLGCAPAATCAERSWPPSLSGWMPGSRGDGEVEVISHWAAISARSNCFPSQNPSDTSDTYTTVSYTH